jgi:serine/threonine-protein kinase
MAVGNLRLATGDAAEAEAAYRQALAIVPQAPDVLIGLAAALAAGGKPDEAESTYKRAIAVQRRYATSHLAYGSFLALQGRPSDAAVAFERATLLAPDNPSAFNNLGAAYVQLGDFDKAAGAFQQSLALEPRRSSYSNAATVHYYRGRHREAADMFRKAIEFAPGDHRLWGNLADALFYVSQAAEAMKSYRRALDLVEGELEINPRHAENQAQAAYYASRLGNDDRARQSIAVALTEGDASFYVHYYVALAELGLGDKTSAIAHIRRARQLGYPESLLRAAPELGDIRTMI